MSYSSASTLLCCFLLSPRRRGETVSLGLCQAVLLREACRFSVALCLVMLTDEPLTVCWERPRMHVTFHKDSRYTCRKFVCEQILQVHGRINLLQSKEDNGSMSFIVEVPGRNQRSKWQVRLPKHNGFASTSRDCRFLPFIFFFLLRLPFVNMRNIA